MKYNKDMICNDYMLSIRDIQNKLGCTYKESLLLIKEINSALLAQGKITAFWGVPVKCYEDYMKGEYHANLQGKGK